MEQIRSERRQTGPLGPGDIQLEVHFGKPVVARVKKCRLVVVKKKHSQDDNGSSARAN